MAGRKKCIIFGAGERGEYIPQPEPGDLVIAADGGFSYASDSGISVDLLIGDFDSLSYRPAGVETVELQPEKDDTDTFSAIKAGLERGYLEFHIFGGTGGRLDHTLANVQALAFLAQKGASGFLYSKDSIVSLISNSSIAFNATYKGTVSVLSYSPAAYGVNIRGMKYSLYNSMLSNIFPLGVSNSFIGEESEVSVESGMLLVIFPFAEMVAQEAPEVVEAIVEEGKGGLF
jgi:thiamine pyrophosphokinase